MVRLTRKTVDVRKSGSIQHFYQASFCRIKSDMTQALIFVPLLIHQGHCGFLSRKNDAFDEQKFPRHFV